MLSDRNKSWNYALVLVSTVFAVMPLNSWAQMSDDELRTAVGPALEEADAPDMQHILDEFIANEALAIALGKAFYWDEAAGSDGQACASCHFHAGTDNRSKNQLNPGLRVNPPDEIFDAPLSGGNGGPNYQLVDGDFGDLGVPKEFNDVISSMGVHSTEFVSTQFFDDTDVCTNNLDIFHVNYINTRRVEPRNTPTVINSVFNHRNFWDGRANNIFNGVTPLGLRSNVNHPLSDPDGGVGVWRVPPFPAFFAAKEQIAVKNSSLASQAVGPPEDKFEMSCLGRKFPMIGRKMLTRRALAGQTVSFTDSHFSNVPPFGNLVRADGDGLKFTYGQLLRMAFKPEWWRAFGLVDGSFTQMEANFSLYWGLTIQLYEAKLISHETPFDTFVRNIEPNADDALTENQKRGLEVFLGDGKCINCHVAPEFTGATVRLRALQPDGNEEGMERMIMGNDEVAVYDGGFYNIGVRATQEDLCVGGVEEGFPISFSRQASAEMIVDKEAEENPAVDEEDTEIPQGPVQPGERVAVDGACKVPGLRNAELTGPFFHNGGAATLRQVVLMYQDQFRSLFSLDNIDDLDPDILEIDIDDDEVEPLVAFLRSLTDERVRLHAAPFDHPSITLFNGHITNLDGTVNDVDGNFRADDDNNFVLDAVGAVGFPAAPLQNFLNNCTELDPNHPDFTEC